MTTLLEQLNTEAEVVSGAIRTGAFELEWNESGLRVRATEEEWLELSTIDAVQVSRSVRVERRFLRRAKEHHRWHVELRASDLRIKLMAPVSNADTLEGLPFMDAGGEEASVGRLLEVSRLALLLGAELARWTEEAVDTLQHTRLEVADVDPEWTQVGTYFLVVNAHIARLALEGEGIPVLIHDETSISVDPASAIALGGVKVYVPGSEFARAREVLER